MPPKDLTLEFDIRDPECSCGSKKPFEECCGTPRFKTYITTMSPLNLHKSDGMTISTAGELQRLSKGKLLPLIGKSSLSVLQKRESKRRKLLSNYPGQINGSLNPDLRLLDFRHILVVDTNSKVINGKNFCRTAMLHLTPGKISADGVAFKYAAALEIEFLDPEHDPEKVGWLLAIETIKSSEILNGKKVAIATDHDQEIINSVNRRELKICGKVKLPKNIKLIFATADRGEYILNKLMRKADMLAAGNSDKGAEHPDLPWIRDERFPCAAMRVFKETSNTNLEISSTNSIQYLGRAASAE